MTGVSSVSAARRWPRCSATTREPARQPTLASRSRSWSGADMAMCSATLSRDATARSSSARTTTSGTCGSTSRESKRFRSGQLMRIQDSLWIGIVASCFCWNAQADWVNALTPQGKPAGPVKVVKAGKPQGGIQLPDRPTPQETNAAVELQHWIKELTGATLDIKAGKAGGSRIAIRTDGSLGDEGYAI